MHDIPPHQPDTRHPLAQQADESQGRIKRIQRDNASMRNVPRGSEVERREAGRGHRV
ncbi:hypothetical protein B0I00_0118 [Novosphingobium kunmingense]|uniref:Uncharacterized protein n=1 Tax=Novosphingobium kunmingense TaxID=1211806 RepID=A0A2N0I169_9SPHN|nr:hypothetical protein [Novosphingobium kunmingense]PKB24939.1 hypothetical protein B0I00_0118 [Novosphingobium kunmingense]